MRIIVHIWSVSCNETVLENYAFLVYVYYTHPGYQISICDKNRAYYIRIFMVSDLSNSRPTNFCCQLLRCLVSIVSWCTRSVHVMNDRVHGRVRVMDGPCTWPVHSRVHSLYMAVDGRIHRPQTRPCTGYTTVYTVVYLYTAVFTESVHGCSRPCTRPVHGRVHGP